MEYGSNVGGGTAGPEGYIVEGGAAVGNSTRWARTAGNEQHAPQIKIAIVSLGLFTGLSLTNKIRCDEDELLLCRTASRRGNTRAATRKEPGINTGCGAMGQARSLSRSENASYP
jgi:hypothetical protein